MPDTVTAANLVSALRDAVTLASKHSDHWTRDDYQLLARARAVLEQATTTGGTPPELPGAWDEQVPAGERTSFHRHLRAAHPNLFGAGPAAGHGFATPLPDPASGSLSSLPFAYLYAVHDANHRNLYLAHTDDDWLAAPDRDSTR